MKVTVQINEVEEHKSSSFSAPAPKKGEAPPPKPVPQFLEVENISWDDKVVRLKLGGKEIAVNGHELRVAVERCTGIKNDRGY